MVYIIARQTRIQIASLYELLDHIRAEPEAYEDEVSRAIQEQSHMILICAI